AGSTTDLLARTIADRLRALQAAGHRGEPTGLVGTSSVAKAASDGHTLMLTSNGHTVIGSQNKNLSFDPIRNFRGVTQVATTPLILVAPPQSATHSVKDLIHAAKEKPGALNYGSAGLGSTTGIAAELFEEMTGYGPPRLQHTRATIRRPPTRTHSVIMPTRRGWLAWPRPASRRASNSSVAGRAPTSPRESPRPHRPGASGRERLVDKVARHLAIAQANRPRRGRHEDDGELLLWIHPEICAVDARPVVIAGGAGHGGDAILAAHRDAKPEAVARSRRIHLVRDHVVECSRQGVCRHQRHRAAPDHLRSAHLAPPAQHPAG